jgi:hypothetical protein
MDALASAQAAGTAAAMTGTAYASPVLWIRLGEGAPSEPGTYLRATDVAAWLRSVGDDDLADLLADADEWPLTETTTVMGGS